MWTLDRESGFHFSQVVSMMYCEGERRLSGTFEANAILRFILLLLGYSCVFFVKIRLITEPLND